MSDKYFNTENIQPCVIVADLKNDMIFFVFVFLGHLYFHFLFITIYKMEKPHNTKSVNFNKKSPTENCVVSFLTHKKHIIC